MSLRQIVKAVLPEFALRIYRTRRDNGVLEAWAAAGRPVPPPHPVKQRAVAEYARRFNCKVLVETGTYQGDMIWAQLPNFQRLITIEVAESYWKAAKERFRNRPQVELLLGDSGEVLADICPKFPEPVLFWLDGHCSGGDTGIGAEYSPILRELDHVFGSGVNHVALIDDARLFLGDGDYPTIAQVEERMRSLRPDYHVEVKDDILRVIPK